MVKVPSWFVHPEEMEKAKLVNLFIVVEVAIGVSLETIERRIARNN